MCGACDVCCTAPSLKVLKKPVGVRCAHLVGTPGKSCSIYERRPVSCAEYVCLWRMSDHLLPDAMYPARCGFVISLTQWEPPYVVTVTTLPAHPQSWNRNHHRAVFARTARDLNCMVVIGESPDAELIFAPSGRTFARADFPEMFTETHVGIPRMDFLPRQLTPQQFAAKLLGVMQEFRT